MSCQANTVTVLLMHRYAVALAAKDESWRWGFHSCNGLSAGADVRAWKDPHLWEDVMAVQAAAPIHAFVGGGDQIYNDALWSTPSMQAWLHLDDSEVHTQRLPIAISVLPTSVHGDMPCHAGTCSSLQKCTATWHAALARWVGGQHSQEARGGGCQEGLSWEDSSNNAIQLSGTVCAAGEAEAGA